MSYPNMHSQLYTQMVGMHPFMCHVLGINILFIKINYQFHLPMAFVYLIKSPQWIVMPRQFQIQCTQGMTWTVDSITIGTQIQLSHVILNIFLLIMRRQLSQLMTFWCFYYRFHLSMVVGFIWARVHHG